VISDCFSNFLRTIELPRIALAPMLAAAGSIMA